MMPTEPELKVIVEKSILLLPANPTATDIINNIQKFLLEWYRKKGLDPTDRLTKELKSSEIF